MILPAPNHIRRGLSRVEAAQYVGISPSKFDEMVEDGRMPKPRRIDTRKVWDVVEIDIAFETLPRDNDTATDDWQVAV
jgi:predicted DNA-binding transcriptional regulator AlpA